MIFRIRKDPNNPYVIVNKGFVYDPELSAKAKGILLYLLSRPDDWQVYESEVIKHFKDGRDSIRAGITELQLSGYITRTRMRDTHGRMRGMQYEVFEIPQKVSKDGFSNVGESNTTNIDLTNNDLQDRKPMLRMVVNQREAFRAFEGIPVSQDVLE